MPKPSSTALSVPPCLSPESASVWARLLNYVRHTQRRTLLVVRHDSPRLPRELPGLLARETGRPLVVATVSDTQPDPMAAALAAVAGGNFEAGTLLSITGAEDLAVVSPDQSSVAALHEFARRLDLRRDQFLPAGGVVLVWATARVFDALAEHALNFISRASAVLSLAAAGVSHPIAQTSEQRVSFDSLRKRFRLPPLPKDAPETFNAALDALAELVAANELYQRGGANVAYALGQFDAWRDRIVLALETANEWSNLKTPASLSSTHDQIRDFASAILVALAAAGATFLDLRLHPLERVSWFEAALNAANRCGDDAASGAMLGNLGNTWMDLGDARKAIRCFEEALAVAHKIGSRHGEGTALGSLGNAYIAIGNVRKAIDYYEQWLAIAREVGDRLGESSALGNLGNAWAALNNLPKALDYQEQQLAIARKLRDRHGEGYAIGNLGITWARLGDAKKALEYYNQQLAIARETGDRRAEASGLGNLGNAWAALDNVQKALDFYEQQLVIARETGSRELEANALFNSALAFGDLDQRSNAHAMAVKALTIYDSIESPNAEKVRQFVAQLATLPSDTFTAPAAAS